MATAFISSDSNLTNAANVGVRSTNQNISKENVLNSYRSYTYNFTLACLPKSAYNSNSYRGSNGLPIESIILKSGGKGNSSFKVPTGDQLSSTNTTPSSQETDAEAQKRQADLQALTDAKKDVTDFNNYSAGVFDMYIENVQITTAMNYTVQSNTTLFTKLSFEVYEPFSIQGFVEAMHAAAVANGYRNYTHAVFLLKMEFKGYSDSDLISEPKIIPKSTRFFPFKFKALDVELTESGTRYRCECLPASELGFGLASELKNSVQCSGNTVETLLNDFIAKFSEQVAADNKEAKGSSESKSDEYSISIEDKDISSATFGELLKGGQIYKFEDPGNTTNPNAYKLEKLENPTPAQQADSPDANKDVKDNPVSVVVNGQRIIEFISAVIRDSSYLKNILSDVDKAKDSDGNIKFWVVNLKTEILNYDDVLGRDRMKYTYEVKPRLIPANSLPAYQSLAIPEPKLLRTYNYIYSGKNTDVLNFQARFNQLFIQSLPRAAGNNAAAPAKDGAAPTNSNNKVIQKTNPDEINELGEIVTRPPLITRQFTNYASEVHVGNQINAAVPRSDPAAVEARNTFYSLIENSNASFLEADMDILGDPFYLVTKGGNYNPTIIEPGITVDNEADHYVGPVYIGLLFRAARDILPLAQGGGLQFNKDTVYSGVFQIFTVESTFQNGLFKQKLRMKKVITPPPNISAPSFNTAVKTIPNPKDQTVADAAKDQVPLDRRSNSLADAIKGVNNIVNSVKAAKAQIVASINGAVEGIVSEAQSALAPVVNTVDNINSKIQQAQTGIADAAAVLGLAKAQIGNLNAQGISKLLAAAKSVPENVNVGQLQKQGVIINLKKIQDLPATTSYKLSRTATAATGNTVVNSTDPGSTSA